MEYTSVQIFLIIVLVLSLGFSFLLLWLYRFINSKQESIERCLIRGDVKSVKSRLIVGLLFNFSLIMINTYFLIESSFSASYFHPVLSYLMVICLFFGGMYPLVSIYYMSGLSMIHEILED